MNRHLAPICLIAMLALILAGCSWPAAMPVAVEPVLPPVAARPSAVPVQPSGQATRTLTVFAAASLTESFGEIGKQFEAEHPGVKVVFNFAGSQQLSAQLNQGAPADVFASANTKEMVTAVKGGAVVSGTQKIFARNRLVVIFPKNNSGHIVALADLARPGLKIDVADNSVPAGQYTLAMLDRMSQDPTYGADFKLQVVKNIVSYESDVKAVVSKVSLDEVDAGVAYTTDAGAALGKLDSLKIPDQFNQVADYAVAPVARASQPDLARQFVAFVLSDAGQEIMARHGFITNPVPIG